jgi:His/Glu/Gln/Arg/opine family amino acid ABC transporter permease subunit
MWKIFSQYWKELLFEGVKNTIILSIIALFFGAIIGACLAFGRMSKFKPLSFPVGAVVEVVRGTPMLLQLYIGVFGVPMLVPKGARPAFLNDYFVMVAIVLVINSAAYVSEIIRSGIQAVDKGQNEAARSLGLSKFTTMTQIILPQAVKNILPALGNEFITVIKETSLASTFAVGELMTKYDEIKSVNYNAFPAYIVIGIIYFVLTYSLSKIISFVERKMKHD